MKSRIAVLFVLLVPVAGAGNMPEARQVFDRQLSAAEGDLLNVVQAMPARKFNYAPSGSAFQHVRTFGEQARHIAFCLNEVAVALLGDRCSLIRIRKARSS